MKDKIITFGLLVVVSVVLFLLSIYPLLAEGREITQTGESLYQEWRLVSIPEFYSYVQYAQNSWRESTKIMYIVLALIYLVALLSIAWFVAHRLVAILQRKREHNK